MDKKIHVIGGGLAGAEAAYQAARLGVSVVLHEMKPNKKSPAHSLDLLGELVCSNSFKAEDLSTATGLMKEEMRRMGSLNIRIADETRIPAGGALAVDRELFAEKITKEIKENPNIEIRYEEVTSVDELPENTTVIIATGPLTSEGLLGNLSKQFGLTKLNFFDAAAPIVYRDSINMDIAFMAARYNKGTADYINCPMNKEQYLAFCEALVNAETAEVHDFDKKMLYEGCMPIESMAHRGTDTMRFGPLKPVGLDNPDGSKNYAVAQLRRDDTDGKMYNIVGFQTRLKFSEQKRVFGMIPGLENAEFARYGVMHKNTYIKSPGVLDRTYEVTEPEKLGFGNRRIYFAGQITGVEGYMESANSGMVAGINAAREILGEEKLILPRTTATGALAAYVAEYKGEDFQPMGMNFGIIEETEEIAKRKFKKKDKKEHREAISEYALSVIEELWNV